MKRTHLSRELGRGFASTRGKSSCRLDLISPQSIITAALRPNFSGLVSLNDFTFAQVEIPVRKTQHQTHQLDAWLKARFVANSPFNPTA
jgi:hypothetical protein